MQPKPTPVVAACIVRDNGILLALRYQPEIPDAHLKWELPGGKIRFCEIPDDAIAREIREELAGDSTIRGLLPHLQTNIWETAEGLRHTIILGFECALELGQQPRAKSKHVADVRWFNIDEIDYSQTLPGTREFIDCLSKVPYASLAVYVRLEKFDDSGHRTHFYEIYQTPTLAGPGIEIFERKGAFGGRSEQTTTYRVSQRSALTDLSRKLTGRLHRGYRVTGSQPDFSQLTSALSV